MPCNVMATLVVKGPNQQFDQATRGERMSSWTDLMNRELNEIETQKKGGRSLVTLSEGKEAMKTFDIEIQYTNDPL
jgi:hypothetical protein